MKTSTDYGLKYRTRFTNALDSKLFEQLKELSDETDIPMSKLLDRAVELLLKEYEKDV